MRPPRRGAVTLLSALVLVAMVGPAGAEARGGDVDDPVFQQGLQWGLTTIHAPAAWRTSTGKGKTIAIVDSGADLQHEDLAGKIVGQVSCIRADGDPSRCQGSAQDDNGHGTHVAGIAAAVTDNGRGIAGVAPDADLLIVRVLSTTCASSNDCHATGSADDVAAGIRWATQHGADVINLSLGGGSLGGGSLGSAVGCAICDAVDEAWQAGAIPVIAAGNDAALPPSFADEPAVVVTATTRDDGLASYSNPTGGPTADARWPVAAPGGEGESDPADCATGGHPQGILSTYWMSGDADQYACLAGTSMAAPHVSGALALLLATGLTSDQAISRLLSTAEDLGPAGRDDGFGYGRIDLEAALEPGPPPSSVPIRSGPPTTVTGDPTTEPSSTTTAPSRSAATASPPASVPVPVAAAPFSPVSTSDEPEDVPRWLTAIAIGLIVAVAIGLGTTAAKQAKGEGKAKGKPGF